MQHYDHGEAVLIGLTVYMVIMLAIGAYASRRVTGASDFLVAGRRLGNVLGTGALFATWFGAGTAMGGAGKAYIYGNQGVIFDPWGQPCVCCWWACSLPRSCAAGAM